MSVLRFPSGFTSALLFFCSLALAPLAPAMAQVKLAGHSYDTSLRLADNELQLNGVGVRAVAIFKAYTAGLYLKQKASDPAAVVALDGPKRLQMRMLIEVPAKEFIKAIEVGMTRNSSEAELPALRDRMQTFERMVDAVGAVRKGDVVDLDWLPGKGMRFSVNGQARGANIGGEDFYGALLRIFIGDKPVDKGLKSGLLGS